MVTHNTTAQLSYDPETGAWDGQLPHADLVDQLSPPIKEHSLPELDNTVKTLFYWAMDLDIPHGPRLALLTILRHIDWKEGDHCIAGIQTLARESQFSKKTLLAPTDKFSWGSATGGPAVSITSKKRRSPKAELDSISGRNHSGKTGCNHRYRRPAGQAVRGPRGDCEHRVNLHGRAQSATAEAGSAWLGKM